MRGKKEIDSHQGNAKRQRNFHYGRWIYPFEMGKNQKIYLSYSRELLIYVFSVQSSSKFDCLALFVYFQSNSIITKADFIIASVASKLFKPSYLKRSFPYLFTKGNFFNVFSGRKGDLYSSL